MSASRRLFLRLAGASALTAASGVLGGCARATSSTASRRLAMVVDLRKCLEVEGCRACIDACHRVHNVPAIAERRHEVKWVWKEQMEKAFGSADTAVLPAALRHRDVLVLCNHCDNPPCVRACPTGATWRRDSGLVTIDQHRCIGCRSCIAACPYGARSFNWTDPRAHIARADPAYPTRTDGVAEKCTFCEERVATGLPPACVAACPAGALVFGDVRQATSDAAALLDRRYSIRRKPALGTLPQVHYLVDGEPPGGGR